MRYRQVRIDSAGEIAWQVLSNADSASVVGVASRGLYLLVSSQWVVYLSFDVYKGPLTLNIQGNPSAFPQIEAGAQAHIVSGNILFPSTGFSFPTSQANLWRAPAPSRNILSPRERQANLQSVIQQSVIRKPISVQLAALIPLLWGEQGKQGNQLTGEFLHLSRLQQAWQLKQVASIIESLQAFLGLGAGLTPSGDDLVAGFLLACNRWGEHLVAGLDMEELNKRIQARAIVASGIISSNLITCASRGQADERLLTALDGIITGEPDPRACVHALESWGSSSGFDALVGMAIALNP